MSFIKHLVRLILFFGLLTATIFLTAGRWDLPAVWAALGLYLAFVVVAGWKMDPELKQERWSPGTGGVDRHLRWLMMPLTVATWIVVGLDVGRFHWSRPVPLAVTALGFGGLAASLALTVWAMMVNRFFSPVVRIQAERGHHVISTGPYRYVRHPGYLGALGGMVFAPLAMGSWWALLPNCGLMALMLRRLLIEDRYLHEHLPGYTAYAQRVRWRLLPGIW